MIEALDDNPDEQVPVLSEDWVIDHLTDKKTLEQQEKTGVEIGCCTNPKDFGVNADTYHKLPHAINAIPDKPVFTQEAHKAGELPPILSKCEFNYQEDSRWPTGVVVAYYGNGVVIVDDHDVPFVKYQHELRPIDNRSDEERLRDAVWESTELRARDGAAGVVNRLLSSDKFTIALNK